LIEHTPKKRRTKEPAPSTEEQQFDPDLDSHLEQAVDDRHCQIMSAQAPLKERIEEESANGAGNEESANGSANEESAKGSGNEESAKGSGNKESAENFNNPAATREERFLAYKERVEKIIGNSGILSAALMAEEVPHSQESTNGSRNSEGGKDSCTQESSSASIADKNAKVMTDSMWQEHPSMLAQLPTWSMSAQKSAKTVFLEESAKGSSQKWGDADDEDMNDSPQKNDEGSSDSKDGDDGNKGHNATIGESASCSVVVTEKSNNGSPSGKDEHDPTSAQQCRKGSLQWVRGKLQERQHPLSHSPADSPGRVNPPSRISQRRT
jgi:hypothetical protein